VQATIHLAPRRRPARPRAVPDVRGLFYPLRLQAAGRYGLVVRVVRLTERQPNEGSIAGDRLTGVCAQR